MGEKDKLARFEEAILPHMDAAYNIARWLTRNERDAEDMVQESYLRAFKFFDAFTGVNARAWLLTIVRNTCYTWLQQNRGRELMTEFDEKIHSEENEAWDPAAQVEKEIDGRMLAQALEALPAEYREAVVLRDLEGLSYKEIADVVAVPVGTVMSRLARARARLKRLLTERLKEKA
ncbi:MAG TPA: sigma-70 family RNA polymerase sigma factor [Candidatus Binatia bacterium]